MSLQSIIRKRESTDRTKMEFPNRSQEHNPSTRQQTMTPHEVKNIPKVNSCTPGIVHIGKGVKVTGTFEACDVAEIFGSLDGEIQTRELVIHEGGQLTGMAICKIARISGILDGEIEASELLQIQKTGRVQGKIGYARLVIEDGGLIKGEVSPKQDDRQQIKPELPPATTKDGDPRGKNFKLPENHIAAE